MKTRRLHDMQVSEIGLGCMGMDYAYDKAADCGAMITLICRGAWL